MKGFSVLIVLFVSTFPFSCSRLEEPANDHRTDPTDRRFDDFTSPVLDGFQDPGRYTVVLHPDVYVVLRARPYGYNDLSALVVARSGLVTRTFVAPAAMGLKTGDVIKVFLFCYRAEEESDATGALKAAKNACTDYILVESRGK